MSQNVGKAVAKISTFPWCQDLDYHVWRLSFAFKLSFDCFSIVDVESWSLQGLSLCNWSYYKRVTLPFRVSLQIWLNKLPSLSATGSYLDYYEQVAQAYDGKRQEKSNEESVKYEGFVIDVLRLWPQDAAHRHLVQATEDHSGQDD